MFVRHHVDIFGNSVSSDICKILQSPLSTTKQIEKMWGCSLMVLLNNLDWSVWSFGLLSSRLAKVKLYLTENAFNQVINLSVTCRLDHCTSNYLVLDQSSVSSLISPECTYLNICI